MNQLTPTELSAWLADDSRKKPVLLDVRESWEFELCSLPASLLMPMQSVPARQGELDPDEDVVVICHHGMRSMQVVMFLQRQGFSSLYNLSGGIEAWAAELDPAMRRY